MGRIIFSVILLVLLTVLIILNLGPTVPVNLFGARFQNVPVVAVAMLSFVVGVVYSFLLYIGQYFHRASRQRLAKKHQEVAERERKLAAAGDPGAQKAEETKAAEQAGGEAREEAGDNPQKKQSSASKFFRKFL